MWMGNGTIGPPTGLNGEASLYCRQVALVPDSGLTWRPATRRRPRDGVDLLSRRLAPSAARGRAALTLVRVRQWVLRVDSAAARGSDRRVQCRPPRLSGHAGAARAPQRKQQGGARVAEAEPRAVRGGTRGARRE